MENLSIYLEKNIGKRIILYDDKNFRWAGVIQKVYSDFLEIFEERKKISKVFKISNIKSMDISDK